MAVDNMPAWGANIDVSCPAQSLQEAVNGAQPGDVIRVSGVCGENILIRNEKQRLTIQGMGFFPGINAPDDLQPAINVRGKGILIQSLLIEGGRAGIDVNRGSNAVINNMIIGSSTFGIRVDQQSFAAITNSQILQSTYGIFVDESSTVRIGYNQDTELSPSPNTIKLNQTGIEVRGSSNAKIGGNTIIDNTGVGIVISGQSTAVIGDNNIGNNSSSGIFVTANSSAALAVTSPGGPAFLSNANNSNAGSNGAFGVSCTLGGLVRGSIGSVSGASGAKSISPPCSDFLF
jgi:parallel beta-helix repeat protein